MIRPRIYVCGPLSADTHEGVALNVAAALDCAEQLYQQGWAPVVPHTQGEAWHARHPHHYEEWMELCHGWLLGCDALYRMPGESSGADREVGWAVEAGMPIARTLERADWLVRAMRAA